MKRLRREIIKKMEKLIDLKMLECGESKVQKTIFSFLFTSYELKLIKKRGRLGPFSIQYNLDHRKNSTFSKADQFTYTLVLVRAMYVLHCICSMSPYFSFTEPTVYIHLINGRTFEYMILVSSVQTEI